MTKLTKLWGALALIFAAGMTWGAPVQIWNGDFTADSTGAYKKTIGGVTYTLTLNGNEVKTGSDGKTYIEITNSDAKSLGVSIARSSNTSSGGVVLFKYSDLSYAGTGKLCNIAALSSTWSGGYNNISASHIDSTGAVYGMWADGYWSAKEGTIQGVSRVITTGNGVGYFALSYVNDDTAASSMYKGTEKGVWTKISQNTGKGSNTFTIRGFSVGGLYGALQRTNRDNNNSDPAYQDGYLPATGMKIHAIAFADAGITDASGLGAFAFYDGNLIEITVSSDTATSQIAKLASLTEDSHVKITIDSGKKLTLDRNILGHVTIQGDGTLYVPSGTSATLKNAAVSATVLVEGTLTTEGIVSMSGSNKFDSGSILTVSDGVTTISKTRNGNSSYGDSRGLMGTVTIENGATLALNCGDAINYSADASHKTVLNVKGTLNCGNKRQSFKANNIVNLYVGGTIIGTGDSYAALDFTADNNQDAIHVLDYADVATKTATISAVMRGNAASRPIAIDVPEGVELTVSGGIKQGKITKAGAGTLTLSATNTYAGGTEVNAGTVKTSVTANLNGKTITVGANGTLEYAKSGTNGDWNFDDNNLSGITGTGKIKFTGSGFLTLAPDSANKLWADTLEVVNELGDAFLMESAATYTIGSLSGSGKFRYDCGTGTRELVVKQTKNTTWSGKAMARGSNESDANTKTRFLNITVKSTNDSVLTYTGANDVPSTKIIAGAGATIKSTSNGGLGEAPLGLNGGTIMLEEEGFTGNGSDGKGYTIVSDGGTIRKTNTSGNAYSKIIKSLTLNADTAITGYINGIGTHSDTTSTLALGSNTLTITSDSTWDNDNGYGNFYFYNTTITGTGTLKMEKGNLLFHTKATTAAEATIEIGASASIQVDQADVNNKGSITVKNLTLKSGNTKSCNGTITVTGTLTYDSASNFTLPNAVQNGNALVKLGAGALTIGDKTFASYKLNEGTIIANSESLAMETDVADKVVSYDSATKTYSLVNKPSPSVVTVTIGEETTGYATIDEAIEAAANATTAEVKPVITLANGVAVPQGFVKAEDSNVITAAKYIVISPSSYVENWEAYVTARKASPVAEGITFGVKNASEIYTAYPANAENTNGDPRNDAESIHKYIGMMQKLGTKYFVLGGRWVDVTKGAYDRTTLIPGIVVYPKAAKASTLTLETISSDLYYACHYKADGKNYVWDPSGDGVYVGLHETNPDQMEDVRHFQPNCVVSRMNFFADTYGETSKSYADLISAYTAKLQRGENDEQFAGSDRYAVWATRCQEDVDGKPDCYPAQKARAEYIPTVRTANEVYFSYLLNTCTEQQAAEARGVILGQDWELMLPVEHGTADGLGNLQGDHIKASNKLIKFFMGNVPCMTGQVTANGCFADVALSNPNGGTLVSINNTSTGYASESGMAGRFCGVSDELVDWCLNSYANGSTAGEAWRYAIASYTSTMLDENGFKAGVLEARGHDGEDDKYYVIAAFLEQELFGDPLVKIQTAKGASNLGVTVERAASIRSLPATSFDAALTEFAKTDAKSMTVMKSCGNAETAITVPAGKTLAVDNATLTASTITVDGTFVGAGTVNANFEFGANATLDTSRLTKLTIGSGAITSYPQAGINFIVPEGTTQIPAVLSLLVANSPSETAFHAAVKSITAKGAAEALTPHAAAFKLESYNGKVYLVDEGNVIEVPHFLTGLGATVATITIEDKEGYKRELELARDPENPEVILDHYLVPAGSKVVITITPDAEHSGANQTKTINSAADLSAITDSLTAYTTKRAAATVFYNAGTGVEYTGAMAGDVVNSEGHDSQILDGDTVVFDGDHAVPAEIVVGADPKGAKLVFEKDVTLTTTQTTALFAGKDFEIHADHKLTFKPGTADGFTLGNCTMDKGTAVFLPNGDYKTFKLDSIVGTTLLNFRPGTIIEAANASGWIHFQTRVTGDATVNGKVRILGESRIIVKDGEYIKCANDVSAEVEGHVGEYHRLTIDAFESKVTVVGEQIQPIPVLKLKDKASAEAIIPRINLIAPNFKKNDKDVIWQLFAEDDGTIKIREMEFTPTSAFFQTGEKEGKLDVGEKVVWYATSAFESQNVTITAACPAEIEFNFAGAADNVTITVDRPIVLSGSNALTFVVPEGRTVYVSGAITGTAGVRKEGKGTLIFSGTADNLFEGALLVGEGTVRTTKAHGYSRHRDHTDGSVDTPQIDIYEGATLDIGNVCDLDDLAIISAGTITNSIHKTTDLKIGKIKTLTLKGDTTVCGHTFGMAKDSKIVLEGHKLTIAMERGECVTTPTPDGTGTEVHDHEFELNNTQVSGGKDDLDDPDIVVVQGTLSCEGSTYVDRVFTKGVNNLGNASLYISKEAAIRLDADLMVKRLQIVDAMNPVTVKCCVTPDGQPTTEHKHIFPKIWEESVKPDANPTLDADNQYFGKIIIRMELRGGLVAPRAQFGHPTDGGSRHWFDGTTINDPLLHKVILGKGEYIDCAQECDFAMGYVFTMFFMDWSGESGARRIFHGWEKYSQSHGLADIVNPYAIKIENDGTVKATLCDWYPYGAWSFRDDPCDKFNTLPLADNDWAYAMSMWPLTTEDMIYAKTLVTTITTMDGAALYTKNGGDYTLNGSVLNITNNLLNATCRRGDGKLEFVVDEKWLVDNMGREEYKDYVREYAYGMEGGNGTISKWLNATGKNGIERWQSYMLGLDPESKDSLPVLAVRNDVPPSVQKEEKTFVNVKVGGIAPRGYQYISPVYQIEELDPETMTVLPDTVTPWQKSVNFQVEVPTKTDAQGRSTTDYSYLKYFRVNVSFQGSDGMN